MRKIISIISLLLLTTSSLVGCASVGQMAGAAQAAFDTRVMEERIAVEEQHPAVPDKYTSTGFYIK